MLRPCFLVIDPEHSGTISTRKLVIESAKFNVITAYSAAESLEAMQKFPAVDGIVLDTSVDDIPCDDLLPRLRKLNPRVPVIALGRRPCDAADHYLESFIPERLLDLLQRLQPKETAEIRDREQELQYKEE